jgi:tRNA pseudouridine55 synthase
LLEARQDEIVIEVLCSKGTYIRTLAEDLLASVGQRAHLLELRRLGAAPFSDPAGMFTLDRLGELAELGMQSLDGILLPPVAGIADWPRVPADAPEIQRLNNGQRIRLQASAAHGRLAVLDLSGRLRFLGQVDAAGVFHPERLLHVRD